MQNDEDKPVTFSQLKSFMQGYMVDFYQKIIEPGMERMFDRKFEEKIQRIVEEIRQRRLKFINGALD